MVSRVGPTFVQQQPAQQQPAQQQPAQQQPAPQQDLDRMSVWIHEHPTTTKVLRVAGLILGIGLLVSLPFTAPVLGIGITVSLALSGILLTIASAATLVALDLIVPPHHDMRSHVYKPQQCDGGRLYYEGDVPILSLDADDPFKAGKAHGYLCGAAIYQLMKRVDLMLHTFARASRAHQLPNVMAEMRRVIPQEYLREMEGLVEGYNQWSREQYFWRSPKKLTVDDVLLVHLMPDSVHFDPGSFGNRNEMDPNHGRRQAVGCSAIVDRESQNSGFVFARNMDWPSFGLAGAYSFVIHRKYTNGLRSTVEVGIPGFIGTLTGMNDQGLSLAMNVCSGKTTEIRGMPAALYNRACLETCRSAQEVEGRTRAQSPLGAYHLTIADRSQAQSIHFYQGPADTHVIRRWEKGQPLSTLNCRYSPQPGFSMHSSEERQQLIDNFFATRGQRPLEDVLALPFVNNWITTHRVVMEPTTGRFRVAFNNAFAGTAPLREVPTRNLFPR
jgi:hypothetical protein